MTRTQRTILEHLACGGQILPRNWSTNIYEYSPKRRQNVRRATLEQMRELGWIKLQLTGTKGSSTWVITNYGRGRLHHHKAVSTKRLKRMIGAIEGIHTIVCDKKKENDRAGDVIVSLRIEGKWYEVIRLTERCNYFAGLNQRYGLSEALVRKNARPKAPGADENWNP